MNYLIDGFPAAAHWNPDVTHGDIGSLAPEVGGAAWRFFARIAERPYIPSLNVSLRSARDGVHMLVMIDLEGSDFAAVTPIPTPRPSTPAPTS